MAKKAPQTNKKTAQKNTVAKKTVAKKTTEKKPVVKKTSPSLLVTVKSKVPHLNPNKLIILFSVVGVFLLLYLLRDQYLVAMVNNQPVTRWSVLREAEQQSGKEIANQMVDKTLIMQEAQKRDVKVTDDEIDAEIKKIEDNLKQYGQSLDSQLASLGMSKESLRENIFIQKVVEKMIAGDIKVSDKEIDQYLEQNKELLQDDVDEKSMREGVQQQLKQEKLSQKYQEFMNNLRKNASIQYFRTY